MRYILVVQLIGFYVRELGMADRPALVHHRGRVVDVSEPARELKVSEGQPLQEAKLLLREHGTATKLCEADFRDAADRWMQTLLTAGDTIQPDHPARAYVDLSAHPEPLDVAARLLRDLHRETGLALRAGLAPARWLARLASRPCDAGALDLGLLPIEAVDRPAEWLAPRGVRCLSPLDAKLRERLERLGVRRVRDLQALPESVLKQQFGKDSAKVRLVANGQWDDPVRPLWPPDSITQSILLERCENTEELRFALLDIAQRCVYRLNATDRQPSAIKLLVAYESARYDIVDRKCGKAIVSTTALFTLLQQMLLSLNPSEPVERLQVTLLGLTVSVREQASLWANPSASSALSSALSRVAQRHGAQAVRRATEMPMNFEQRMLRAWKEANGWH